MSNVEQLIRGESARLTCTFRTTAGALQDPSAVRFLYRDPAGAVTTWVYGTNAQLQRLSLGVFLVEIALPSAGAWYWRWEGSGSLVAASEGAFVVAQGQFA